VLPRWEGSEHSLCQLVALLPKSAFLIGCMGLYIDFNYNLDVLSVRATIMVNLHHHIDIQKTDKVPDTQLLGSDVLQISSFSIYHASE